MRHALRPVSLRLKWSRRPGDGVVKFVLHASPEAECSCSCEQLFRSSESQGKYFDGVEVLETNLTNKQTLCFLFALLGLKKIAVCCSRFGSEPDQGHQSHCCLGRNQFCREALMKELSPHRDMAHSPIDVELHFEYVY